MALAAFYGQPARARFTASAALKPCLSEMRGSAGEHFRRGEVGKAPRRGLIFRPDRHDIVGMLSSNQWRDLEAYLLTDEDLALTTTDDILRKLRYMQRHGFRLERPSLRAWREFAAAKKRGVYGPCGPAGLRHYVVATRHLLGWRGRVAWPELVLPTEPHPTRGLLPDVVLAKILTYDQDVDELVRETARAMFVALFYWTLRPPSELYSLRLQDVDRAHARLRVWMEKLDRYETTTYQDWEIHVLDDYLDRVRPRVAGLARRRRADRGVGPAGAVFLNPLTGTAWPTPTAMGQFLRRHIKRVDARAQPYDLRVSSVSWIYAQTFDVEACRRRLRHTSTRSTDWYLRAIRALISDTRLQLQPYDGDLLRGGRAETRARA